MSDVIRRAAVALVQSQVFLETMTELVALEMERQLRGQAAGERIYVCKSGSEDDRKSRDELIRAQFCGGNFDELKRKHGLSERQIRRIVKRK